MATVAGCRPRPPSGPLAGSRRTRGGRAGGGRGRRRGVAPVAGRRRGGRPRRGGAGAPVDVRPRARPARRRRDGPLGRRGRLARTRSTRRVQWVGDGRVRSRLVPRFDAAAAPGGGRALRGVGARPGDASRRGPLAAGRPGVGLRSPPTAPSGAGGAGVVGARRRGVPTTTSSATDARGDRWRWRRTASAISSNAASSSMPPADAALARGLVIGDDRDEPPAMIERFRRSGLSHLTAVSGENVAFVLAAAGPLLRRLRPSSRWAATLALIGWFVALTRFEPSVLRAGVMAGAWRRSRSCSAANAEPARLLARRRDRPAARRSDAGAGRSASGCRSARPPGCTVVGPPLAPTAAGRSGRWRCRWRSRSAPSSAWPCRACSCSAGCRSSASGQPARRAGRRLRDAVRAAGGAGRRCRAGASRRLVMAPCRLGVRWVDAVAYGRRAPSSHRRRGRAVGWWLVVVAVGALVVVRARRRPPDECRIEPPWPSTS